MTTLSPAARKQIIKLGQHHAMMAEHSVVPELNREVDADRSYVERADEARDYHLHVAEALRNHLREANAQAKL